MIAALQKAILDKEAPVVVGLDPVLSMLPEAMLQEAYASHGESLEGAAGALLSFNKEIIDYVHDLVPAVKPQIAMYERYGVPGVAAYEETIRYAKAKGLFVIADIKRGDIGSTAAAYAQGHLGETAVGDETFPAFGADFATVNAYLGADGVQPFLDVCKEHHKGIFVLVKTSNPGSGQLQDQVLQDGRTVYEMMADYVDAWGKDFMDGAYSDVGAVTGATYPAIGAALRKRMPHTFFLVPGYGAQGATAQDLKPFFASDGTGAIVNSSRGIIAAWKEEKYVAYKDSAHAVGEAARRATQEMIHALHIVTGGE